MPRWVLIWVTAVLCLGDARAGSLSAQVNGTSLALRLTGTFAAGAHGLRLAWFNDLNSAPLGSGTFQGTAAAGAINLSAALKATPGVYRMDAALDGAQFASTHVVIPGAEKQGGDFYINGQPFSGFFWYWRGLQWIFKKEGGRYANITVDNLLRPVADGGFGFNCIFTDNTWQFKPNDFDYLKQVGGHVFVQTCMWAGLNPWGPKDWNAGITPDPIILSDGTPTKFGSFDSPRNRDNFVRDLKLFKSLYGSPPALLGFYMFESTPDMPWDNRSLYSDYSPASKDRFRQWLARRFGTVDKFNGLRGGHLGSFAEAEPPASPDDATARGYDPAYWNDWIDFRYWDMADFLGWARGQVKTLFGQDKMLVAIEGLTSSYAANDPDVTGANSQYAIDERLRAHAADAIGVEGTYDYLPNHTRILRRATEFDGSGLPAIPILMDYYNYSWQPKEMYAEPAEIPRLRFVDELGEGATGGILEHTGEWMVRWEENAPHMTDEMPGGFRLIGQVNALRSRYQGLFAQARAPHDISVVIPVWQLRYDPRYKRQQRWVDSTGAAMQQALQRSQREIQMLYADEPLPAGSDALFVPTGYRISLDFISRLEAVVKQGGRVYLEGNPMMDETGHAIPFPLQELVGATVAPESETEFNSMDGDPLKCKESWKLENVEGDVLAKFADGSAAVVRRHYFNGEVIYCPSMVGAGGAAAGWSNAIFETNFPEAYRRYYDEIAGEFSKPLMRIVEGASSPSDLRLHLLVTKQTELLLVTNWSAGPQHFVVRLGFPVGVAADLRAGRTIPINHYDLSLQVAGHDWAAIALSATPAEMAAALQETRASFALEAR